MALESNCDEAGESRFLNPDVLSDVMSRVDGSTLAKLSCVNTQFRSICQREPLWENLCNQRWPSTKQLTTLIASVGGFRKLYNDCFPFVMSHGEQEESVSSSAAEDFVSIVDVTCHGEPVLSSVVDGIPGAAAACGPLVDILAIYSDDDGPVVEASLQNGCFGIPELRVSWILLNKKTRRMVNLASWKPLSGLQQRPRGDNHFLLRFGCILPNPNSGSPVHCNITLRCRPLCEHPSVIKLTDFGLTLENSRSVHLRGDEAVAVLSRAMSCDKTALATKFSTAFHEFLAMQTSNREAMIRREKHRETAHAMLFVGVIVIILISHVLV